jgi:beta-glucanase (GH16 family)
MRHETVISLLACLVGLSLLPACSSPDNKSLTVLPQNLDLPEWKLLWQDDFTGNQLDTTKWDLCKRGKSDWDDTMSDDPRLLKLNDGILHLYGIVNDQEGQAPATYMTAGITSKGKFAFQYGKVQIRARFKSAQGAWPALWMVEAGKRQTYGEIDLMEHLNFDDKVYQTIHSEYTLKIDKTNTPKKGCTAEIKKDDWNTYGCEWDTDKIVFFVNDKPTMTYPRVPALGPKQWPFDQPFFFILSMQIGGSWVNRPGATNPAHYPAGMEIDWVRVYTHKTPSK